MGTWQLLPPAPIEIGSVQTSVWTGREVMFTYAAAKALVAAAYDPAANSWRQLPNGPAVGVASQLGNSSVWTGKEMLVGGPRNAAFNPATNRWRRLVDAASGPVVVWTGSQMIGWGGGCCGESSAEGVAYSPATNTARKLPAAPLAGRQTTTGAWTGKELIIVGGADANGKVFADAAAYNPKTRSWRRLPPLPTPRRGATAVWDGRDVLVVGGDTTTYRPYRRLLVGVFAYRPATNRWRRLRPMPRGRTMHVAVWTGKQLLVSGGATVRHGKDAAPRNGLAYNPASNRWAPLPVSPLKPYTGPGGMPLLGLQTAIWTGKSMIVTGHNGAAVYTP